MMMRIIFSCDLLGKWHVGVKRVYDMMPAGAVTRLAEQRLESMKEPNNIAMAEALAAIAKFESENQQKFDRSQDLMKEELHSRPDLLLELEAKHAQAVYLYRDPGAGGFFALMELFLLELKELSVGPLSS